MERLVSLVGLVAMIGIAWLLGTRQGRVSGRIVAGGLFLQFAFAVLILKTEPGIVLFQAIGEFFTGLLGFVDQGAMFVFGVYPQPGDPALPPPVILMRSFAFGVLPTIVFFSSLMAIMYHLGIMQRIVGVLAWAMQRTLGTSGAESLSAAANVFVGQTEAPLMIRPYVSGMTLSELNAVMVGGFATIAGGVMAAYVRMGIDAGHLVTASVISAPAALLIAKVMQPETERPQTLGRVEVEVKPTSVNVIEAAAVGAADGVKLAITVGAMLIAFLALLAMLDAMIGWVGLTIFQQQGWSFAAALSYVFWPIAWLLGIPWNECYYAGQLLGIKMVANEFVAYERLTQWMTPQSDVTLSERTVVILTYALAGFSNFGSIGIQIGGIGGIAPERRSDLARLGLRAMIGGTLACLMTACVAALLI